MKRLRYYARFVVVCLLLKRMRLVRDLARELAKQVEEYTSAYEPEDQVIKSLLLQQLRSYLVFMLHIT